MIVALVALAVHLPVLHLGFALDDIPLVERDPRLAHPGDLGAFFLRPYWPEAEGAAAGLYRPLTTWSFALNRALAGDAPHGFHAVNLLLHGAVCALAWFAARRAGVFYGTAILAALLFAVHPVHVEAVANVAGRAELLAAGFALGAWLAHRRSQRVLAPLLYLLAVLSKEGAVLAPLLFLVDDLFRQQEGERLRWRGYAGYAGVLAVAVGLRAAALGGLRGAEDAVFLDNPAAFGGPTLRIATALWVVAKDLLLLVWPAHLVSDYSFDAIPVVRSWSDPRLLAGCGAVALPIALVLWSWRRSRPVFLGAAAFLLFLLPVSNLLFPVGTLMAERLLYLPAFGLCLIAGHLGAGFARRGRWARDLAGFVAATLLVLAAARTWTRIPAWNDNATLALADVQLQPRSAKLHAGEGIALQEMGKDALAEDAYRRALAIWPDYAQIHYNLALLLDKKWAGSAEAITHLKEAIRLAPNNPKPYRVLAPRLETAGRSDEALAAYAAGAKVDPEDLPFRFNYGRALIAAGKTQEGLAVLESIRVEANRSYLGLLAEALAADASGRVQDAVELYGRVIERPDVPEGIRARARARLAQLH